MPVASNVRVAYCHTKTPKLKYQEEEVPGKPLKNKQYTVDVCVPAPLFKQMLKKYKPLGVKAVKEAREHDAAAFEKAYKYPAPEGFGETDDEGKVTFYTVKFTAHADYPDGSAAPRPTIVGTKDEDGVNRGTDNIGQKVGPTIGIGNGTLANVQFKERKYTYKGKTSVALDLVAVQVLELTEFSAQALEFDMGEMDDSVQEQDPFDSGNDFAEGAQEAEQGSTDTGQGEGGQDDWGDE